MRVLIDSQIFIWTVEDQTRIPPRLAAALEKDADEIWLSVATLWETRLKQDKGKLKLSQNLAALVEDFTGGGGRVLAATAQHALHVLPDLPATADPFDRMLLAQCDVENMRLLTADAKLQDHRLAWR